MLLLGAAATLTVPVVAEMAIRIAEVEPTPWPARDGTTFFEGIEVDPLLGPMPRANYSGDWFDLFETTFDAQRFRTTGYPPPEHPRASIAFLGDSCTFGWKVGTKETFVAQLDAHQRTSGDAAYAFLNAAYPGQTAVVGEAILQERVLPLRPQLVVIGFSSNNAFRFAPVTDSERFRFFGIRKLLLHSRLFYEVSAWLANRNSAPIRRQKRVALTDQAPTTLRRLAAPIEFEAALRRMTAAARAEGVGVVFLLLPRASSVSTQFAYEDVARPPPLAPRVPGSAMTKREVGILEASCLEPSRLDDPLRILHEQRPSWHPVFPADEATQVLLQQGAQAYVDGDYSTAISRFTAATMQQPDSPLAFYDLGVARLSAGRKIGFADLEHADALACNVFLHYLVAAWRVARDLDVPVVDISLYFQAHNQGDPLFLDEAHPTAPGHRIIADALWPVLERSLPTP